jgi:hypothetical protein
MTMASLRALAVSQLRKITEPAAAKHTARAHSCHGHRVHQQNACPENMRTPAT